MSIFPSFLGFQNDTFKNIEALYSSIFSFLSIGLRLLVYYACSIFMQFLGKKIKICLSMVLGIDGENWYLIETFFFFFFH